MSEGERFAVDLNESFALLDRLQYGLNEVVRSGGLTLQCATAVAKNDLVVQKSLDYGRTHTCLLLAKALNTLRRSHDGWMTDAVALGFEVELEAFEFRNP